SWRASIVGVYFLGAIIGAPPYVRAWIETGSPTYPFELSVAGHVFAPGNDEMERVHSGHPPRFEPIVLAPTAELDPVKMLYPDPTLPARPATSLRELLD